mgnify:CR=1 FL=1
MDYLQTIRTMNEAIKKDHSMSKEDKEKAKELMKELSHLLAVY